MESLTQKTAACPYCGESIEVLIDQEEIGERYIEDCQVCCKPIIFFVSLDSAGSLIVSLHDENEAF
jgi:hypothetical protein